MQGDEQLYLYLADYFDLTQTARGAELLEQAGRDYYRIDAEHKARVAAWNRTAWERLARACVEERIVPGHQGVYELPAEGEESPGLCVYSTHWKMPTRVAEMCAEHF